MPKYLVLHTLEIAKLPKDPTGYMWSGTDKMMDLFTKDCHCIASWIGMQGFYTGKMACLWEAPSKQAIIDLLTIVPVAPVDAIFDSTLVVDWAEEKKKRAKPVQQKAMSPAKKAKAPAKKASSKKK